MTQRRQRLSWAGDPDRLRVGVEGRQGKGPVTLPLFPVQPTVDVPIFSESLVNDMKRHVGGRCSLAARRWRHIQRVGPESMKRNWLRNQAHRPTIALTTVLIPGLAFLLYRDKHTARAH